MRRFYFRLARELGYPHPDHLLRALNSRQLAEWIAFCRVEQAAVEVTPEQMLARKAEEKLKRRKRR